MIIPRTFSIEPTGGDTLPVCSSLTDIDFEVSIWASCRPELTSAAAEKVKIGLAAWPLPVTMSSSGRGRSPSRSQMGNVRYKYFVEDDRDGSGHLQVQHPAPVGGFVAPRMALGGSVRQGDMLGEKVTPAAAADDGIVLFLGVVNAVYAGDALGGD